MNIFVAKLNYSSSDEDIRQLFEQFGEVASAKVIFDKETGKSKGFGFVEMPNDNDGLQAIQNLNEKEFQGRDIVVKQAHENSSKGGSGGGNSSYSKGGNSSYRKERY